MDRGPYAVQDKQKTSREVGDDHDKIQLEVSRVRCVLFQINKNTVTLEVKHMVRTRLYTFPIKCIKCNKIIKIACYADGRWEEVQHICKKQAP